MHKKIKPYRNSSAPVGKQERCKPVRVRDRSGRDAAPIDRTERRPIVNLHDRGCVARQPREATIRANLVLTTDTMHGLWTATVGLRTTTRVAEIHRLREESPARGQEHDAAYDLDEAPDIDGQRNELRTRLGLPERPEPEPRHATSVPVGQKGEGDEDEERRCVQRPLEGIELSCSQDDENHSDQDVLHGEPPLNG